MPEGSSLGDRIPNTEGGFSSVSSDSEPDHYAVLCYKATELWGYSMYILQPLLATEGAEMEEIRSQVREVGRHSHPHTSFQSFHPCEAYKWIMPQAKITENT